MLTGSLDDTVKVWEWTEGQLALRHTLEGHALGVMSVDIAGDGAGKRRTGWVVEGSLFCSREEYRGGINASSVVMGATSCTMKHMHTTQCNCFFLFFSEIVLSVVKQRRTTSIYHCENFITCARIP